MKWHKIIVRELSFSVQPAPAELSTGDSLVPLALPCRGLQKSLSKTQLLYELILLFFPKCDFRYLWLTDIERGSRKRKGHTIFTFNSRGFTHQCRASVAMRAALSWAVPCAHAKILTSVADMLRRKRPAKVHRKAS